MSLPLITHLIMVAHKVLPIKNNGLPKKNLIFILEHFEWPREKRILSIKMPSLFANKYFYLFSVLWNKTTQRVPFTKQDSFSCQRFHDNHTKIFNSHWSFQETLGRGVQTKKPSVGGGGNVFFFSGTTQCIEGHVHVIWAPQARLGTLWSENGIV